MDANSHHIPAIPLLVLLPVNSLEKASENDAKYSCERWISIQLKISVCVTIFLFLTDFQINKILYTYTYTLWDQLNNSSDYFSARKNWHLIWVPVHIQAAPLPIQLPCNVPAKAAVTAMTEVTADSIRCLPCVCFDMLLESPTNISTSYMLVLAPEFF